MNTILELLPYGSHIISMNDLYGGTYRLFERVKKLSSNFEFSFIDKDLKSTNILRWSPNDKYLASACDTLVIYEIVD
jgi:cystathionine beta-lyase/cystathionine gamma-synthase